MRTWRRHPLRDAATARSSVVLTSLLQHLRVSAGAEAAPLSGCSSASDLLRMVR
jgi:hypothetical protein